MVMADRESGAQATADSQPDEDEIPITRVRKCTEKALQERIKRLKDDRKAKLTAVTKQRNALTNLMADESNLHLVKAELGAPNTLFYEYREAFELHYQELIAEDEQYKEFNRYEAKEKSFLEFRNQVTDWIVVAENRLAQQLDLLSDVRSNLSGTSKTSQQSKISTVSSTKSA